VSLYLTYVSFGARNHFDGLLSFTLPVVDDRSRNDVERILRAHCPRCVLASLQQVAQGDETEHAYQVRLRKEASRFLLVRELENVQGLKSLSLLMQETLLDQ
jgi:hypothetical protein